MRPFVLQLEAEAKQLAADVGDLCRPLAAGEAHAGRCHSAEVGTVRDWAIEQEVQDVTVPDYTPGEVSG